MLKYRILTAIVAIPLVIWAILALDPLLFAIIMGVVMAGAAWEWSGFLALKHVAWRIIYVLLVCLALYASLHLPVYVILGLGFLLWLWSFFIVYCYNRHPIQQKAAGAQCPWVRALLGIIVLSSTWISMIILRWPIIGARWLLFTFIIVWITDTGAYFVGRQWGKRKLAVNVSPNKTWEGVWGGILAGLVTAIIISFCVDLSWPFRIDYWLMSLLAIIFSVSGDLTVSVFKRQNQLKDSGKLFPGHGGILDRLDSITPAVVIYAFGILFLMR